MPASVEGIFPITFPYVGTSKLQAQWWNDIIACSEQSTDCYLWKKETNQWDNFPSLTYIHGQGSMSVIGSKVIVIGGEDIIGSIHGQVEIYDRTQGQWILGPPLAPIRRIHTTVVFNDSLIVVGGYNGNMITSVKILDLHTLSWKDLDDLPIGRCEMPCNVINNNYILCIGGEEPGTMAQSALGLDMSLSNPVWEMKPMYDLDEPVRTGFIFHLNEYLFCMTLRKANYESARTLRRMNLTKENPTWEVLASYPDSSFVHVSPYVFTLYKIQT
ncbi:uncharacterized protein LOC131891760 [Tigriopus californicus]|uniref:uncharacterized protein LOC131891760 n=1 Tax=Tigriopus californicus TaxID=6832 RepID=UPI0027DAAEA3|nr:uncharacterized protein LOC131891760 [Tigriopus californicus]